MATVENSKKAWFVWGIAGLFYFYQFILRASPNVMADQLMDAFAIQATSFGFLASCYYWTYTLLQVPVGVLLDHYGPKAILRVAVLLCSGGVLLFAVADHFWLAVLGRTLIGAGAASAFLGTVRLSTLWFSPAHLAVVVGLTVTLGKMGGVFANYPLTMLVDAVNWRGSMALLSLIGFGISALVWLFIRNGPKDQLGYQKGGHETWRDVWVSFKELLTIPNVWWVALYGAFMYTPVTVFTDVWGLSFLTHVHGMDSGTASLGVTMILVGCAVGAPLIALFSDSVRGRWIPMALSAFLSLAATAILIWAPSLSLTLSFVLMFFMGIFVTGQTLIFIAACEKLPPHMSGMAIGVVNTVVMLGGVVFQPLVGSILDLLWKGESLGCLRLYSASDYRWALSIIPISIGIACLGMLRIQETYPKP